MVEAEHVGMQAETAARVIAIAILDVATYGMAHIGSVNANLVLPARLQLKLHE